MGAPKKCFCPCGACGDPFLSLWSYSGWLSRKTAAENWKKLSELTGLGETSKGKQRVVVLEENSIPGDPPHQIWGGALAIFFVSTRSFEGSGKVFKVT